MPRNRKTNKLQLVKVGKKKNNLQVARVSLPKSRSLVDSAIKTVGSAIATGNIPMALMHGALDAGSVIVENYLKRTNNSPITPAKIGTVSAPAAKQMAITGSMGGVMNGLMEMKMIPDGLLIHQTVYVGEAIASLTTGSVYLYAGSNNALGTFIGPAATTSDVINAYPCFPVISGAPTSTINGTGGNTTIKPEWFFPPELFLTNVSHSFRKWKPKRVRVYTTPTCPTSTAGVMAMAWSPADINEVAGNQIDFPNGQSNSFYNMAQCPVFSSQPVWKENMITFYPGHHGIGNGDNWLETHMHHTSSTESDPVKSPLTSAGTIIFSVLDNASLAAATSLFHVFADYVYVFQGMHTLSNQSVSYMFSLGRQLSQVTALRSFISYLKQRDSTLSRSYRKDQPARVLDNLTQIADFTPEILSLLGKLEVLLDRAYATRNKPRARVEPDGFLLLEDLLDTVDTKSQ